jgi:hypothetical protein
MARRVPAERVDSSRHNVLNALSGVRDDSETTRRCQRNSPRARQRREIFAAPQGLDRRFFSCLNGRMKRWFFGYFFYFPRPLAEGNG